MNWKCIIFSPLPSFTQFLIDTILNYDHAYHCRISSPEQMSSVVTQIPGILAIWISISIRNVPRQKWHQCFGESRDIETYNHIHYLCSIPDKTKISYYHFYAFKDNIYLQFCSTLHPICLGSTWVSLQYSICLLPCPYSSSCPARLSLFIFFQKKQVLPNM